MMNKNAIFSTMLFVLSTILAIGAAELVLRIKNNSMKNYDIEMWRYAKELKIPSKNPRLGHEHVKNASALLQSVNVRTNEWGLRGGSVEQPAQGRRILVLGGSITLGWGVPEEATMTVRLEQMLRANGEKVEVLNAGVGNYNAERYVERFFEQLRHLNPSDILVHYFLRDAEKLDPGGGNFILHNSELAVTLWIAANRLLNTSGERSLVDHYNDVYREDRLGFIEMKGSLKKLADYARSKKIRIFLAMVPDVHNLKNYQFGFVHEHMKRLAAEYDYHYIDLLPALGALSPEEIWAMPGDPHPNARGHELMAAAIAPILAIDRTSVRR
jgi:GDSL-like Lipase/Acylhydrolase family